MIGSAILTTLAPILIKAGAPLLKRVLEDEVGGAAGKVGSVVVDTIGAALGVEPTPEAIVAEHEQDPAGVEAAIRDVEASRDWIMYLAAATAARDRMLEREDKRETFFAWGWRPAMSWLLIWMWFQNTTLLPSANAIFGSKIELTPWDQLVAFGAVWLVVYGGGHTLKSVWGRK